jgi:hypothetical protein
VDAEKAADDGSDLADDVLLQICRVSANDPQVTPEWLSRLRLVTRLLADPRLCQHARLEAAMTLLASALGQLTQFNPTHLPFGHEGPEMKSREWMERRALERVGKQIVGLIWCDAAADAVAVAVERAVSEGVRLGFLEQRQYDAWQPGMRSGSGWRWAVTATPYGVTRALVTTRAPRRQYAGVRVPRDTATAEAEGTTKTMADSDCENPSDIRDVRDALSLLSVRWRTEEQLARLHTLAERSIFAARQMIGAFRLADTPRALPEATFEVWLQHLLQTAVEIQLFPDHVPDEAASWDALAKTWDEYIAHSREFHLSGVQRITEGDPWSIRGAAKAAWNIEFALVSSPAEIGSVMADSAHRAALRWAPELWLAFSQYTNEAQDHPPDRPRLWDAFTSRWCSESVQDQCERVRACLATELVAMHDRLALSVQAPSASSAVSSAAKQAGGVEAAAPVQLSGNCEATAGQGQATSAASSDDRYEWARQIDLVRATSQVLGDGMLNKGVLSRACADGQVETNGKTGRGALVRVRSFLTWVSRQHQLGADEATQIRNAVIGEISSRNS